MTYQVFKADLQNLNDKQLEEGWTETQKSLWNILFETVKKELEKEATENEKLFPYAYFSCLQKLYIDEFINDAKRQWRTTDGTFSEKNGTTTDEIVERKFKKVIIPFLENLRTSKQDP